MYQRDVIKVLSGLLISLSLGACLTPSPLSSESEVEVTGRIVGLSGQPVLDQRMSLSLPLFQQRQTDTNAAGDYQFQLKASETTLAGLAVDLTLKAEQANGMAVTQDFKALKTQIQLPEMQFWSDLQAPAAEALIASARQSLSWQSPLQQSQQIKRYRVRIEDPAGDTVWKSQTPGQSLIYDLPTAVLEPQSSYRWQIEAEGDNYSAFSEKRSLQTGGLPLQAVAIQKAQVAGKDYPSWFDQSFQVEGKARLDLNQHRPLEIDLKLPAGQRVQGLHWAAQGFSFKLEVRDKASNTLLAERVVSEDSLFEWTGIETDALRLLLSTESGGFVDIREIRVLGPAIGSR